MTPFRLGPLPTEHDYSPDQDFTLRQRPDPKVVALVYEFLQESRFGEALGLPEATYYFGSLQTSDHLARYANGTSTNPVITLDDQQLRKQARRNKIPMRAAVWPTLLHELGHAYVDSVGLSGEIEDEEEIVEGAAHLWWDLYNLSGFDPPQADQEAATFLINQVSGYLE